MTSVALVQEVLSGQGRAGMLVTVRGGCVRRVASELDPEG